MQSLLQTQEWASLRSSYGWQAYNIDGISILKKPLLLGLSFLYAPEVEWEAITNLQNFLENIKKIAQNSQSIFFRLEILDEFNQKIIEKLRQNGFIKSFEELQPEWRQIIDISKSEEEILAQMKPKGRYNIKIAQKHGVKIKEGGIGDFYRLYQETAKREKFSLRSKEYFEKMFELFKPKGVIELLTAKFQDKIIAAEIVGYYDGVASYLYGASSNNYRNAMAPYLLHWEAICRAKAKGCSVYDLLAVAPFTADNQQLTTDNYHKFAGITRFKEQFGGRRTHLVGAYDIVYKPIWYKLFKMAEKMRR